MTRDRGRVGSASNGSALALTCDLRVTKTMLNAYTAATRLADPSALDAELMAAVVAENGRGGAD